MNLLDQKIAERILKAQETKLLSSVSKGIIKR